MFTFLTLGLGTDLSLDAVTFSDRIVTALSKTSEILQLFTKEPTVYFTAIAFVGAIAGVCFKLVPMKRR